MYLPEEEKNFLILIIILCEGVPVGDTRSRDVTQRSEKSEKKGLCGSIYPTL